MPIDIHSHYIPPQLLAAITARGEEIGVRLLTTEDGKPPAVAFDYGFKARPFFPKLVEPVERRCASLDQQGLDRQFVATWPDIYGYGLPRAACAAWHRMLNDTLSAWCNEHSKRFSFVASLPLTNAHDAATELDRAIDLGAVSAMVAANVEGVNIGECELDGLWQRAQERGFPIYIHPVFVEKSERVARFGLTQIAQYTFDTTLGAGSLIFSGVLDRFPNLSLVLSHGGGTFPYLLGRFDIMHEVMPRAAMGDVAQMKPSDYASRFAYDTILHSPKALRFLADIVGVGQLALGTDESFPPADLNALTNLKLAGFSPAEIKMIADANARRIFPLLR
jgi:aminocarboxymuconate-semialdehyde decarboxylase